MDEVEEESKEWGGMTFRFRGGVFHDSRGWGVVVEVAGRRYQGEGRYALEESALAEYGRVRAEILPILANQPGIEIGENLGGYIEMEKESSRHE